MSRILRFWVEVEYHDRREETLDQTRSQLLAEILRDFEEAGDAMRYLNAKGQMVWKATPRMLTRLAHAEREAEVDLEDMP